MISTVTPTTLAVVIALGGSLAPVGILTLLALLMVKELTTGAESKRLQRLSRALNIGLVPLLVVFALIVAVKIADALR